MITNIPNIYTIRVIILNTKILFFIIINIEKKVRGKKGYVPPLFTATDTQTRIGPLRHRENPRGPY